jgi:hypothetical protein
MTGVIGHVSEADEDGVVDSSLSTPSAVSTRGLELDRGLKGRDEALLARFECGTMDMRSLVLVGVPELLPDTLDSSSLSASRVSTSASSVGVGGKRYDTCDLTANSSA